MPRGRPRKIENVFTPPKSNVQFSEGQKSKGILDDYAQRINVDTQTLKATKSISGTHYGDGSNLTGLPAATGGSNWLSGAAFLSPLNISQDISGAHRGDGSNLNIPLNTIENPEASKTFNFGNNKFLEFTSVDRTPIAGEGTFNFTASGNFTGDLVHIHQHTGNAGVGTVLLKLEADDTDVIPLVISGANAVSIQASKAISGSHWGDGSNLTGITISETDPIWNSQSGAYLKVADESWPAQSGAYLKIADEAWPSQSGAYLKIVDESWPSQSGAYLKTADEADPIWNSQSGAYLKIADADFADETDFQTVSGAVLFNTSTIDTVSGAHVDLSGAHYAHIPQFQTISGAYTSHAADGSDPHGAIITQTTISGGKIEITGDRAGSLSGAALVVNTIYGVGATPPTASGYTQGTIYVQHAA